MIASPRAEAAPPLERHYRETPGVLATLAGIVGAPLVFLTGQLVLYATVPWVCAAGASRLPLHLEGAATVLLLAACAALSAREWRRAGRGWPGEEGNPVARARFLAATGMALALFLALIALVAWLAVAWFPPCASS